MANIEDKYTGDGATRKFNITFEYLRESDVQATLNNVPTTAFSFANATTLEFAVAPANGVEVRILRETATDELITTFFPGSAIRAQDLNDNANQVLFVGQEVKGRTFVTTGGTITGDLVMNNCDIVFEGSTDDANETTLTVVDPTADRTVTLPDQSGTVPLLAAASNTQITATPEELNVLDDVTAGTVSAGNGVVVNADKDIAGFRNVTLGGELDAATLDISGNADIDGTANLDEVDIDGDVDIAGDVTFSAAKDIKLLDDDASALEVSQGSNNYLKFVTTNSAEKIETNKTLDINGGWQINGSALSTNLTASDLNQLDTSILKTSNTDFSNSNHFPSATEVESRINSKIQPLGGFEAISNEDSFPNTQPDAGVIISIADAGGMQVPANGNSTDAQTANGTAVTVNGFPAALQNTTIQVGIGLMVVSTGANQIYNYHRVIATDADVVQLSDDINDFNNRYRPAAQADYTADNDVGDIYFNTTSNRLRVCTDAAGNGTFDDGVVVDAVRTTGATGAGKFPVGTTAQRPTDANMEGYFRYNSETDEFEGHDGTDWNVFGRLRGHNMLLNGSMMIAQRGTAAVTTSGAFPVDRWQFGRGGAGVVSAQHTTADTPDEFVSATVMTVTTADATIDAGDSWDFQQVLEGFSINDLAWGRALAKSSTVSFWIKSTSAGTFCLSLLASTDGTNFSHTCTQEYTISNAEAGNWVKKVVTFPALTVVQPHGGSARGAAVRFGFTAGTTFQNTSTNAWNAGNFVGTANMTQLLTVQGAQVLITGVQFESGTTATPFDVQTPSEELAACQRYYVQMVVLHPGLSQSRWVSGFGGATASPTAMWYPVRMRAQPTVTYTATGAQYYAYNVGPWSATTILNYHNSNEHHTPYVNVNTSGIAWLVRAATAAQIDAFVNAEL